MSDEDHLEDEIIPPQKLETNTHAIANYRSVQRFIPGQASESRTVKLYLEMPADQRTAYKSRALTKQQKLQFLSLADVERGIYMDLRTPLEKVDMLGMKDGERERFVRFKMEEKIMKAEIDALKTESQGPSEWEVENEAKRLEAEAKKAERERPKIIVCTREQYLAEKAKEQAHMQRVCMEGLERLNRYNTGRDIILNNASPIRYRKPVDLPNKRFPAGQNPDWWWGRSQRNIPPMPPKPYKSLDELLGKAKPKPKKVRRSAAKTKWVPPVTSSMSADCIFHRRNMKPPKEASEGRWVGK
jgi:hypothetical protein